MSDSIRPIVMRVYPGITPIVKFNASGADEYALYCENPRLISQWTHSIEQSFRQVFNALPVAERTQ